MFSPVKLEPAEDAVDDLSEQLADLLDLIAGDIEDGPDAEPQHRPAEPGPRPRRRNHPGRPGADRIRGQPAAQPGARILPQAAIPLRTGLETLERAAVTVRVIARWTADASRPGSTARCVTRGSALP